MFKGTTASLSPAVPSDLLRLADRIIRRDALAEPLFRSASSKGLRILIAHHLASGDAVKQIVDRLIDQTTNGAIAALKDGTVGSASDVIGWMCRTCRQLAEAERSLLPLEFSAPTGLQRIGPDGATEYHVDRAGAREFVASLPTLYRRVITRFYVGGETRETICAEEGIGPLEFDAIRSKVLKKGLQRAFGRASSSCVAGCA